MRFSPKTDKELAESNLLPAGEYDYEVISAEDAVSKSGNEMIKLKLRIFHGESERTIFDYLMEAVPGKLKRFCDQNGMQSAYHNGTLTAEDCYGKLGRCQIGIEKDKSGNYPDRNGIKNYPAQSKASGDQPSDEDVPF